MRIRFALLLLLFTLVAPSSLFASGNSTRYWPVGNTLLDFGTLTPDGQPTREVQQVEYLKKNGSVVLTGDDGELLLVGNTYKFLYKGTTASNYIGEITDSDNQIQGAILLPTPGVQNSYDQIYINNARHLSRVTITPEAAQKIGTPVTISDANTVSNITVAETLDKKGYWIISFMTSGDKQFEVHEFTSTGISAATETAGPARDTDATFSPFSEVTISPDGSLVAFAFQKTSSQKGYIGIYSFDQATGAIAHVRNAEISDSPYKLVTGCAFSPDGRYFYCGISNGMNSEIYQLDTATTTSVPKKVATYTTAVGGFQLASNGKIYVAVGTSGSVGCISDTCKPYTSGTIGDTWSTGAILIPGDMQNGLPTFVQTDLFSSAVSVENIADTNKVIATRGTADTPTEWGLCWSTAPKPTINDVKAAADNAETSFTQDLGQAFGPATKLYVRGYRTDNGGTTYSSLISFEKTGPVDPLFSLERAESIDKTGAVLKASVTPNDYELAEYGFCVSRAENPTVDDISVVAPPANIIGTHPFEVAVTGLLSGVKYHYRPYVKSTDDDIFYGVDKTFTTVTDMVTYNGKLVDENGDPVIGAIVTTSYYLVDGKPLTATTGADGTFTFAPIPEAITGIMFTATAQNMLPLRFGPTELVPEKQPMSMEAAEATVRITIAPEAGARLPDAVYVTVRDSQLRERVMFSPDGTGKVSAYLSGDKDPFDIFIDAVGFKGRKVDSNIAAEIELSKVSNEVSTLQVQGDPQVTELGAVVFTIVKNGEAVSSGSYEVKAYEVGSLLPLDVALADAEDGKSFTVSCTTAGGVEPSTNGVLLKIVDPTGGTNKLVLVNTWLAPTSIEGEVTDGASVIEPVDTTTGGEVTAPTKPGLPPVQAFLPPEGLEVSGLVACDAPEAFLEITVHELGDDVDETLKQRSAGTFTTLAEVNLNIFCNEMSPADPNTTGALKEMIITIPYDASKVTPESLQDGTYKVFHSPDLSDFQSLENLMLVPWEDIILVDPVAGTITFRVNHLSVFGVGSADSLAKGSSGSDDDDNTGCTTGMTPDWMLPLMLVTALLLLGLRRRRT